MEGLHELINVKCKNKPHIKNNTYTANTYCLKINFTVKPASEILSEFQSVVQL